MIENQTDSHNSSVPHHCTHKLGRKITQSEDLLKNQTVSVLFFNHHEYRNLKWNNFLPQSFISP